MSATTKHLKLSKVIKGRDNWRARSNKYQVEKRKLQDKNRYLEQKIEKNSIEFKKIQEALQKKEKQLEEFVNQEKKVQILEKELGETKEALCELKKNNFSVEKTEIVPQMPPINVSINIHVTCVFLFYIGMIP
ncbi:MAG: hypothetical protein GY870_05260, partial [archaeon]|nr:hypothetical protein [archaeon]